MSLETQWGLAFLGHLLACAVGYWVLMRHPSPQTCRRLTLTTLGLIFLYVGALYAFDAARDCDWDAILAMWGWCTPCAYLYYYGTLGCQ